MDRPLVYPGAVPLDTDILSTAKDAMYGLAFLSRACLGGSTCVHGLGCNPTSPASLQVTVAEGSIYSLVEADANPYGSLGTDTNTILKQGLLTSPATLTISPPSTAGYSQVFLVEAIYTDADSGATVLPYYNAANPNQPWSGPNNSGTPQYTVRQGICTIALKAGTAAPTGSQTTPAADSGYVGLFAITVANGQTTITSANIVQLASAPFVPVSLNGIPLFVQEQAGNYAPDQGSSGAPNAIILTLPVYTPNPPALGTVVRFKKIATGNNGACTVTINSNTPLNLYWGDGSALASGDLPANCYAESISDGAGNLFLLSVSGPTVYQRVGSSTNSIIDAFRTGFQGLVGSGAGSAKTASWTIEQIIAAVSLGGLTYRGNSLSLSFNGATTGAGGMDTGSMPTSGDLSIYAIYNPTSSTWSTLGVLGTTSNGTIYSGAHMPSGYTASVLIWSGPTDSSGNIQQFSQLDRAVWTRPILINSALASSSPTSVGSLAAAVPANAKTWSPTAGCTTTSATTNLWITPTASTNTPGIVTMWSSTQQDQDSAPPVPLLSPYTAYHWISEGQTWELWSVGYTF